MDGLFLLAAALVALTLILFGYVWDRYEEKKMMTERFEEIKKLACELEAPLL